MSDTKLKELNFEKLLKAKGSPFATDAALIAQTLKGARVTTAADVPEIPGRVGGHIGQTDIFALTKYLYEAVNQPAEAEVAESKPEATQAARPASKKAAT